MAGSPPSRAISCHSVCGRSRMAFTRSNSCSMSTPKVRPTLAQERKGINGRAFPRRPVPALPRPARLARVDACDPRRAVTRSAGPERRFRIGRFRRTRSCRNTARLLASGCGRHCRSATMLNRRKALLAAMVAAVAAACSPSAMAQDKPITVFAAASMKNAVDDINAAFTKATKIKVVASYAASSALMKQIEEGAPADVFASADLDWMDYGSQKKVVRDDTRVDLLGNKLVLIAPKDSKINNVSIVRGFDLAGLIGDGRITTGDVRSVPVGKYAKAALEYLGVWASVERKFAMVENVRVALTLVARGEAVLGIVYETDAKVEPNVKVVGAFPKESHPKIVYPVALTVTAKPEAAQYLAFLRSQAAKTVFENYGFTYLIRPAS